MIWGHGSVFDLHRIRVERRHVLYYFIKIIIHRILHIDWGATASRTISWYNALFCILYWILLVVSARWLSRVSKPSHYKVSQLSALFHAFGCYALPYSYIIIIIIIQDEIQCCRLHQNIYTKRSIFRCCLMCDLSLWSFVHCAPTAPMIMYVLLHCTVVHVHKHTK